jgi:hypothetical protein
MARRIGWKRICKMVKWVGWEFDTGVYVKSATTLN